VTERGIVVLLLIALVTGPPTTALAQGSDADGHGGVAVYDGCLVAFYDAGWSCSVFGLRAEPDQWALSTLYGYVRRTRVPASQPIFRGCVRAFTAHLGETSCAAVGLRSSADPSGPSTLIGYVTSSAAPGTRPIFHGCLTPTIDDWHNVTSCRDYGLRSSADPWGFSSLIGYASTDSGTQAAVATGDFVR